VRLDRVVPQRWQSLVREALKFGTVGGVNAVINFTVFNVLILTIFANGQLKANIIATVVATTASYLMNRHWTYRDRPKSTMHREYALFFIFNGVGLLIELGVLGVAKYGLGLTGILWLNAAKIIAVGMGTIFRFWAYRTFVFRLLPVAAPALVLALAPRTAEADGLALEEFEREFDNDPVGVPALDESPPPREYPTDRKLPAKSRQPAGRKFRR
jgi:putative flippase GtrA